MSKILLGIKVLGVLACAGVAYVTTTGNGSLSKLEKQKVKFTKNCRIDMKKTGKEFRGHKTLTSGCECLADTVSQTLELPDWALLNKDLKASMSSKETYNAMVSETSNLKQSEWTKELDHKAAILFAVTQCSKKKPKRRGLITAEESCKAYTEEHFQKMEAVLAESGKGLDRETCKTYKL